MVMEDRFFSCETCGNLVMMLIASGVTPVCCGEEMTELVAKSADEGKEKHQRHAQRVDDQITGGIFLLGIECS